MPRRASRTASATTADAEMELALLRERIDQVMEERVAPAISELAERAGELAASATGEIRAQTGQVASAVRERPFAALGAAAAAGFLIALLVRR